MLIVSVHHEDPVLDDGCEFKEHEGRHRPCGDHDLGGGGVRAMERGGDGGKGMGARGFGEGPVALSEPKRVHPASKLQ